MKRKFAVGILILIAVAAVAGGAYFTWLRTPPPMPDNMEQALAVTASPRFERLSDAHKQRYLDRISDLREQMTPQQRQELRRRMRDDVELRRAGRNVMMQMIMNRAKQVTEATGAERDRLLDEDIARFEAMRQAWSNRRGSDGPPGASGPPGARNEDRRDGDAPSDAEREQRREDRRDRRRDFMQRLIEQGNPQHMAYMMEYRRAMEQRRRERGLPPMRGFGRGPR